MIRIEDIYSCKVELTKEGWRFYFFSSTCDFEITVLRDFSIRIRQEKPLEGDKTDEQ